MATPTVPLKRLMAFGIIKGAAWGTALPVGAGYGVLLESDGGLNRTQPYLPANESDTPLAKEGCLGPIDPVSFSPEFTLRYEPDGLGVAMALLFGTAGTPTELTPGVEAHTLQWADENYGNFLTFATERTAKIFEVASAKPMSLDLSVADGLIKGSIGLIGNTLINDSAINTLTQMDALTYTNRGTRVKFTEATVKLNGQTRDGNVAAETALECSDMTIHYERPQDSIHKAGAAPIIEPAENGPPIITLDLQFPRENTTNMAYFATDFVAEVEQKALIHFQGGIITGAYTYYYDLYFPRLRVLNNPSTYEDVLKNGLQLQAEEAASAPTGMSHSRPYIFLVNTRSTDYLT